MAHCAILSTLWHIRNLFQTSPPFQISLPFPLFLHSYPSLSASWDRGLRGGGGEKGAGTSEGNRRRTKSKRRSEMNTWSNINSPYPSSSSSSFSFLLLLLPFPPFLLHFFTFTKIYALPPGALPLLSFSSSTYTFDVSLCLSLSPTYLCFRYLTKPS